MGFILNYGLFWERDNVLWEPGQGTSYRLLGRRGVNKPGLRLADFWKQHGIYILYGNYGVRYVGRTRRLGIRLKNHNLNHDTGQWTRFSWFGFRKVLRRKNERGICHLGKLAEVVLGNPNDVVTDIEALLIRAMGPRNHQEMNFHREQRWEQVGEDEAEAFLSRIHP